jgi:hypothetical protein
MLRSALALVLSLCSWVASADILYTQPPAASPTLLMSSYWNPDGSDYDEYVWDSFTLPAAADITQMRWRGGGTQYSGPAVDFRIEIWASIPAGSQPDIGGINGGRLARFTVGSNANQTLVGSFGGNVLYDYNYTLRTPFRAAAGVKYWVQIEAWTNGFPFWGLASASGGNGTHFHRAAGAADARYFFLTGDAAFTLIGNPVSCSAPNITQHPDPAVSCNTGGTVSFSIAASGTGTMTYRWRCNGNPIYDGPNGGGHGGGAFISGATTPNLTITDPSYWADIGNYDCIVTNSCGVTTTNQAPLTFSLPPNITSHPSDAITSRGGTATFSLVANAPSTIAYQWLLDGMPLVDGPSWSGSILTGTQSNLLTIDNVQALDMGFYSCQVSNDCAPDGIASIAAYLSICIADFNGDGSLDFFDYLDFVAAFSAATPDADFNADSVIDFFDYLDFVAAFSSGC